MRRPQEPRKFVDPSRSFKALRADLEGWGASDPGRLRLVPKRHNGLCLTVHIQHGFGFSEIQTDGGPQIHQDIDSTEVGSFFKASPEECVMYLLLLPFFDRVQPELVGFASPGEEV